MKVYLAGPMRGYPEFNFPAFFAAEDRLWRFDHDVQNPAREDTDSGFEWRGLEGTTEELETAGFDLADALGGDLEWICKHADCVAVLEGWEGSKGATAEVATALALGKPVYRAPTFRDDWWPDAQHGPITSLPATITSLPAILPAIRHGGIALSDQGQKNTNTRQLHHLPQDALLTVGEVGEFGGRKYDDYNYRKPGIPWSALYDAAMRHLMAFWEGETLDPESELPHTAHAAWHCLVLTMYALDPGYVYDPTDDRPATKLGANK